VISGFRCEMRTALSFWDFSQSRMSVSYRRFGTKYRSHAKRAQISTIIYTLITNLMH